MKIGDPSSASGPRIRGLALPEVTAKGINAVGDFGFSPGQLVKARIAAAAADGKVLLDIGGRLVAARSETALETGREVWLEVRRAGATPWFSLAERKGAAQELIKLLLTDADALAKMLQEASALAGLTSPDDQVGEFSALARFFDLFASNALSGEASPDKIIRTMLWVNGPPADTRPSGRLGASLVEDLKALALAAGDKSQTGPYAAVLAEDGLGGLARVVETMLAINTGSAAAGQSFANIFPCFFAQGAGWGEWLISVDRESGTAKRQKNRQIRLDFFLAMSRLGDVHLRAVLTGDSRLAAEFLLAEAAVRDYLAGLVPELTRLLAGLGITAGIQCGLMPANLPRELRKTLHQALGIDPSYSLIDITA